MAFQEATIQALAVRPVTFGLSLFVSYLIGTLIYRLYFHPLAKYPGPFWAKVSAFPSWWHTKQQHRHLWLLSLQEEYGPEFRYQPDAVCINTPTAYRHIYGLRGNTTKSESYKLWRKTIDALNTWNTTSNEIHARKRRVLNHAFSEPALRSAEPFIHSNVDRWIELLGQQKHSGDGWTLSIDMAHQITYLIFDILGDLCFGRCFNMKEAQSETRYIPGVLSGYLEIMQPIACSPWVSLWVWLKPRGLDKLLDFMAPAPVRSWYAFVADCQESRAKKQHEFEAKSGSGSEEARKDFFHWLWDAKDPETGTGYSLAELNSECELLILAGSDTTATVLSACLFYLSRNLNVYEMLTQEILATFTNYEDIKGANLSTCRYLTAFLQESMRMAPPFGANANREVLPGGTTVDGKYLPEGCLVSTAVWAMQYNSDYYPEPLVFRPERWIVGENGSTEESVALAESAFSTFSTGPRGCVGKNMAMLEMRIVIAKLLWKFEMRKDQQSNLGGGGPEGEWGRKEVDQYQTWDISVANRKGPLVQFKERFH